jgi:hypothetical protein
MCIYHSPTSARASNNSHPAGRPLTYRTAAHVIPQGLGQNANVFPPGIVCDGCNPYFGRTLEPALIRHPTLAYDMLRLDVPGRDGAPRQILGNWERTGDGGVLVPMAPPQDHGRDRGRPNVGLLPILDPRFDQLEFRRGLHLLAFNVLGFLRATGRAQSPALDPMDARFDPVRRYIREARPTEAWTFLERYDRPRVGGNVAVHLFDWGGVIIGRIRAFSFEFYVDLLNTGNLLAWAETQGVSRVRLIPPGARFPASPTMDEVPQDHRWWLLFGRDGTIRIGTPWEGRPA